MSGRGDQGGRTGGRGGRGRGRGRGGYHNKNKGQNKTKGHVSSTEEIENDVFEVGRSEHAAMYEKSKKSVIVYIRRK